MPNPIVTMARLGPLDSHRRYGDNEPEQPPHYGGSAERKPGVDAPLRRAERNRVGADAVQPCVPKGLLSRIADQHVQPAAAM